MPRRGVKGGEPRPFHRRQSELRGLLAPGEGAYDEHRLMDPELDECTVERGDSAMPHRWAMIEHACNKWHGIQEEIRRNPDSGTNVTDQV